MAKLLDENGLVELWARVKNHVNTEGKKLWDYLWQRKQVGYQLTFGDTHAALLTYGADHTGATVFYFDYSDGLTVDVNGNLALAEPVSTFSSTWNDFNAASYAVLRGKYVKGTQRTPYGNYSAFNGMHYIPPTANFSRTSVPGTVGLLLTIVSECQLITMAQDVNGEPELVTSANVDEYSRVSGYKDVEWTGDRIDGHEYQFYGSPIKNSLAYYRLNPEAVLNALLGLEDVKHD